MHQLTELAKIAVPLLLTNVLKYILNFICNIFTKKQTFEVRVLFAS